MLTYENYSRNVQLTHFEIRKSIYTKSHSLATVVEYTQDGSLIILRFTDGW